MNKKPVHIGTSTLRFYFQDGWTKEELDACCVVGQVLCFHPHDPLPYYSLDYRQNSRFDVDKLEELVLTVVTDKINSQILVGQSMAQVLEEFNW